MIASSTSTNRWAIALIFVILALPFASLASQTNSVARLQNRFLLIVETSRAMEKRAAGLAAALDQLLRSGMEGQARPGDTIGVWTYNNTLRAGDCPLQTWSKDYGKHLATGVLAFMAEQKLSKSPRFDCVAPALEPIIKDSPFITVIIICTGTDPIKGTSFDKEINTALAGWRDEEQKANMPLIVVLRAAHGVFTHYSVTPASWQIEMPPLPAELVAQAKPKAIPSPVASPKTSSIPSLIVSGKRPKPDVSPSPASLLQPNTESAPAAISPPIPASALTANLSNRTSVSPVSVTRPVEGVPVSPPTAPAIPGTLLVQAREIPASTDAITNAIQPNPAIVCPSPDLSPARHPASTFQPVAVSSPTLAGLTTPKRLILAALIITAIVVLFLLGRSRRGHVSLITHSIHTERK